MCHIPFVVGLLLHFARSWHWHSLRVDHLHPNSQRKTASFGWVKNSHTRLFGCGWCSSIEMNSSRPHLWQPNWCFALHPSGRNPQHHFPSVTKRALDRSLHRPHNHTSCPSGEPSFHPILDPMIRHTHNRELESLLSYQPSFGWSKPFQHHHRKSFGSLEGCRHR